MRHPFEDTLADLVTETLTEGPRTGFEIAVILENDFGTSLRGREGALYAELIRLEKGGFVEGHWSEEPEGQRRRTYRLPVLVDLSALTAPETGSLETGSPETGE